MSNRNFFEQLRPTVIKDRELATTKNGSEIVLLSWNVTASRLVNSRTDKSVRIWKVSHDAFSDPITLQDCHQKTVESVSWNPQNEFTFATVGRDDCVKIWDTAGTLNKEVKVNKVNNIVSYSPDGKYLAAVDRDSDITIMSVKESYKIIHSFKLREHIYGFTWTNTSDFFFLALRDGTVPLYQFNPDEASDKTKLIHTLKSHRSSATCLRLDPRGNYLAVGSNEGVVSLWNLGSLICEKVISSVDEAVSNIDLSRDGTYLAVSYDSSVNAKVFEYESLAENLDIKNSMAGNLSIPQVSFSPAKTSLLFTSDGCTTMTYLAKQNQH